MQYSMHLLLVLATLPDGKRVTEASADRQDQATLQDVIAPVLQRLLQLVAEFRQQRVTPAATCVFRCTTPLMRTSHPFPSRAE